MKKRIQMLIMIGVLSASTITTHSIVFASETETFSETMDFETTDEETSDTPETEEIEDPETEIPPSEDNPEPPESETSELPENKTPETADPETADSEIETPETETPITDAPETDFSDKTEVNDNSLESSATITPTPTVEIDAGSDLDEETELFSDEPEGDSEGKPDEFMVDISKYPAANITANTYEIYQYLVNNMSLNHAAACGVLANIQCESNFSPLSLGDGGTSYGICQWHNGRFSNLISFCNSKGIDYNTVSGQLEYMNYELQTSYPGVLNYLRNVPNTAQGSYDAAYYWCAHFEIPAHTELRAAQRGNLAVNEYYILDFNGNEHLNDNSALEIVRDIRKKMELEDRVIKMRISKAYQNIKGGKC